MPLVSALRDSLLSSLSKLPGTRTLHVNVLLSTPKKHTDLFPYTPSTSNPKAHLQSLLILCSEEGPSNGVDSSPRRRFVSAVESYIYTLPSTSTTILNISKVDSTGQGIHPGPTRVLVESLLIFFANPANISTENLWIHVFARAQNQYLFPNSSDHPSKRVLEPIKLCHWYKQLLGNVALHAETSMPDVKQIKAFYIIAGLDELEAKRALGLSNDGTGAKTISWTYGHPYSEPDWKMPSGAANSNLIADLIPWFQDDPKSRFLDELYAPVESLQPPSPTKSRSRAVHNDDNQSTPRQPKPRRLSVSTTVDEFWEMMSFRQECASGRVTGFFVVCITSHKPTKANPIVIRSETGQVSSNVIERTVNLMLTGHEFSNDERSVESTKILEASVQGLCEGLKSIDMENDNASSSSNKGVQSDSEDKGDLVTSLEVYNGHIYGSCSNANPPVQPRTSVKRNAEDNGAGDQTVNVMAVKRKKKKT